KGLAKFYPIKKVSMAYCNFGATGGLAVIGYLLAPEARCRIEYLNMSGNMIGPQVQFLYLIYLI
ncbi:MAG: hypothetical protein EZS28_053142, partial [Streblomastix strix]